LVSNESKSPKSVHVISFVQKEIRFDFVLGGQKTKRKPMVTGFDAKDDWPRETSQSKVFLVENKKAFLGFQPIFTCYLVLPSFARVDSFYRVLPSFRFPFYEAETAWHLC